jgi:hypothetical protein
VVIVAIDAPGLRRMLDRLKARTASVAAPTGTRTGLDPDA